MKTLILCDVHLWEKESNVPAVLMVLTRVSPGCDIVVLNGDSVSNTDLPPEHYLVVSLLRRLRDDGKLIIVRGNHDPDEENRYVGMKTVESYEWQSGGKRFRAIHGHQFDPWHGLFFHWAVDWLFLFCFWILKVMCIGGDNWRKTHANRIKIGALNSAKENEERKKVDVIICGHAHVAEYTICRRRGIRYVNGGHFKDGEATFVIEEDGAIQLHSITPD
ncbi:MAG: metallophosphoesterase family protein [bacterium]|nr:metallophosphoesterase family protein [bacterium]